jgi:hypothetical protein
MRSTIPTLSSEGILPIGRLTNAKFKVVERSLQMAKKLKATAIPGAPGGVDLDREVLHQMEMARECVVENGLDSPVCTIWTADKVLVVPAFASSSEEKASLKKRLRKIINGLKAYAALMTSKAWLRDLDDPNDTIIGEAIVIAARNAHEHLLAMQKFTRNADGAVAFGPLEIDIVDDNKVGETWFAGCRFVA